MYPVTSIPEEVSRTFESCQLGTGVVIDIAKVKLHINLTTTYIINTDDFMPSLGVSVLYRPGLF